jgi:hypothetical protein
MNRGVVSVLVVCTAGTLEPANPVADQVGRYAGIGRNGEVATRPLSIEALSNGLHRGAIREQCGGTLVDEKAIPNQCRGAVPGNRSSVGAIQRTGLGFFSGGGSGGSTFTPAMRKQLNDYVRRACAKGDPVLHDMGSCATSARRPKRASR